MMRVEKSLSQEGTFMQEPVKDIDQVSTKKGRMWKRWSQKQNQQIFEDYSIWPYIKQGRNSNTSKNEGKRWILGLN